MDCNIYNKSHYDHPRLYITIYHANFILESIYAQIQMYKSLQGDHGFSRLKAEQV